MDRARVALSLRLRGRGHTIHPSLVTSDGRVMGDCAALTDSSALAFRFRGFPITGGQADISLVRDREKGETLVPLPPRICPTAGADCTGW